MAGNVFTIGGISTTPSQAIFLSLWFLSIIVMIPYVILRIRFNRRLKLMHSDKWKELGSPPGFGFWNGSWEQWVALRTWFRAKGYSSLHDPELERLASLRKVSYWIAMPVVGVMLLWAFSMKPV